MAKIILCLAVVVVVAEAGLIANKIHSHFPYFNAVYHGHGATSYQNVQVQNHLSVPIPKDLQVDDGHEHIHEHKFEFIDPPDHQFDHSYISSDVYEDHSLPYRYHPDNYEHYDNLDFDYH
ncbi:uncharacterized protein LOC130670352 [Microplitis mediator]|uniref:uncharacterized protein LOC130670352 n=1 Tax=Microplitis mediator TaxID=375433 RepID=UPI002556213D|nr:uncharacterized protein LOC130670352 [Microplitis mediator]